MKQFILKLYCSVFGHTCLKIVRKVYSENAYDEERWAEFTCARCKMVIQLND